MWCRVCAAFTLSRRALVCHVEAICCEKKNWWVEHKTMEFYEPAICWIESETSSENVLLLIFGRFPCCNNKAFLGCVWVWCLSCKPWSLLWMWLRKRQGMGWTFPLVFDKAFLRHWFSISCWPNVLRCVHVWFPVGRCEEAAKREDTFHHS